MTKMTSRERIQAALRFERPDQLPCHESPWEQTLTAWHEQGLPTDVTLEDFFGFDLAFMYVDASPRFEQKVLSREAGRITYEDRSGYTISKPEGISSTLQFLGHRTGDKEAWERITKPRLVLSDDPSETARVDAASYFGHFDPYPTWAEAHRKYRELRATERYVLFVCYGPWEATWRHRGMENLLMDTVLDSDWVRDMAETFQDLVVAILKRCLEWDMKPDGILTVDDLGTSVAPMISPASWASIFKPSLATLGDFLNRHGIDFWMHSDGVVGPFIDGWLDCGVKVLNPLEAKAGMDVVELRKRYGKNLAFFGNIDATKMEGPLDELRAELQRKIPLATQGGYIMHSDHSCPPGVSLERYRYMLQEARLIFNSRGKG